MRWRAFTLIGLAVGLAAAAPAAAEHSSVKKARAAIERGDVDPARDLAPVVAALRSSRGDGRKDLISAIEDLGGYDGSSPAAVKAYLQREAPPVLLEIAQARGDWVVRSDALMALRSLNATDELLDRAIAIAEADTSKEAGFFRSRAELLRAWKQSRPQAPSTSQAAPADPAREKQALVFLRQRGLGVSEHQLEASAREGSADEVEALLDAGLRADARGVAGSILTTATGFGCATAPGGVEERVRMVRLLIARGADVKARDDVGNTVLLTAARECPVSVVQALVEAGAEVGAMNKMGVAPLSMAFLGQNWDVAEYLVQRGARLKKADIDSVFFELPSDPRKQALIRRATAK